MEPQDKNDQATQREAENNSTEGLKNKSADEQAKFAQGGQPAGHSQGGQGGNQTPHGGENPRHDKNDELSEFAREDS
ncbi:hypothetical protein AAE02nite_38470 [Adhaeribacter aerolatus]|uniref:Uncharacterized protein n=1 Tax=Adhaeribacter aerolatus TaxID=670289 RepID=A0A512B2I7_9BACT|nr:hypothetical protein [Adhaeribacter aerolatus]GEO06183.1 hypothetical protein AAE02nite_38470 [Adhaeribacter aerolatus]